MHDYQDCEIMKHNKRFLLLIIAGFIMSCNKGDVDHNKYLIEKTDKLRKEINDNKTELYQIPSQINKQEQDSIANFNKTDTIALSLQEKQQRKQYLQIKITAIAEQSWREYWNENFPKYKDYINSHLSYQDIQNLSKYVNVAHFTLSCDIDTNYYKSLDDILYGPYWREFADFADSTDSRLIKKYKKVRTDAENKYPYIFSKCVFYDGKKITKYEETPKKTNIVFTESINIGRDILREQSPCPDTNMYEFNRLRNVSKIFTADIHFLLETVFIHDIFNEDSEYIDLQSSLFAPHYEELSQYVNEIISLNFEISRLTTRHDSDVQHIKNHFQDTKRQQELSKMEEIKVLQQKLENMSIEQSH